MADPHDSGNPTSPISQLLKSLGMTREDLVQHTEQMRAHLSQDHSSQSRESRKSKSRSGLKSRPASLSNIAGRTRSSTPPATPVKSEPVEASVPTRQMDTMQLVMERKSRQSKRERRGMPYARRGYDRRKIAHYFFQPLRVSFTLARWPTRSHFTQCQPCT